MTSDVDSIPQSTTEATPGTGGWRACLHTQTEGWSSRMVWTWRVRPEVKKRSLDETRQHGCTCESCVHKCNRAQVRPETNEEAEGIETVTSLLPNLTEAEFVKDARDTSPTSLTREILRMTTQRSWKAMSWTFAWEDQIRSRNLSSMHVPIPTPHHAVPDQKPTRSPRPRYRLPPAPTRRLEPVIAGFDFERERFPETPPGRVLGPGVDRWNRVRQVNPLFFFMKQARPSSSR